MGGREGKKSGFEINFISVLLSGFVVVVGCFFGYFLCYRLLVVLNVSY